MHFAKIDNILNGKKFLGKKIENKIDLMEFANIGITKKALSNITKYFSLSLKQIASLLPVSERTLQRYTSNQHLNRHTSEQVIHITEALIKGTEVFENKQKFLSWLNTHHLVFSGNTPFSMLTSRFGLELVLEELGRIEHGVYS